MVLILASALFSTFEVAISVYGWGGPWADEISWSVGVVLTKSYAAYAPDAQLSDYDSRWDGCNALTITHVDFIVHIEDVNTKGY